MRIQHLPNLPDASTAEALLQQIKEEFSIIATKRGWKITSVTEMCCCGDGLDHLYSRSNKRKTRKMPDNVWGFNVSTSGRQSAIHLRLRMPNTHELLPYESIAQTMAHEMAHCVYGSHSADFYELMEDIIRQHETFKKKGVVLDKSGFPVGSDKVYTLGSIGNNHIVSSSSTQKTTSSREKLDQQRKERSRLLTGHALGSICSASTQISRKRKLQPREATRIAAERRRLEDAKWCLPCNEEIVVLDEESDDIDDLIRVVTNKNEDAVASEKSKKTNKSFHTTIDLTVDDQINQRRILKISHNSNQRVQEAHQHSISILSKKNHSQKQKMIRPKESWICKVCTFENTTKYSKTMIQICEICSQPQISEKENVAVIKKIIATEKSKELCKQEEIRSKEQFKGFNIYGKCKNVSSTLQHLT